ARSASWLSSSGPSWRVSADVLDLFGAALFVSAPAGTHAVGAADEDRLDPADLAALHLEQFAQLPGPVDPPVIEEAEREDDAALPVDGHEPAVANAVHHVLQRHFELALAAHPPALLGGG